MCKFIYYGTRNRLDMRVIALLAVIGINLLLLSIPNIYLVMTVSSLLFIGIGAINLFVSFSNINRLFKAPHSYFTALAPVASWKMLFGTVLPAVILDSIGFVAGVGGVMFQALRMTGNVNFGGFHEFEYLWFIIVVPMVGYAMFLLAFALWRALDRGLFYRIPLSGLLGIIGTLAVIVALSWVNLLLAPIGEISRFGWVVFMQIEMGQINAALVLLLLLGQGAALLFLAASLMDRRINL